MKGGDYLEDKDHHHSNMFAKLHQHQTQKFPHTHHQTSPFHHTHHFQIARDCQTSEEADSRSPGGGAATGATNTNQPSSSKHDRNPNDGATIEVVRRPRGRPPGSKNRPKPPVVITRDSEPSMSPYVLELPGGVDVVDSISRFCRKRNTGLCVLSGTGTVANVTLRQPSTTPGATVTFHGRFDILSISATILPAAVTSSALPSIAQGFTISLGGPQGQIVGGAVVGPLLAAGTVYIVAASFNSPLYCRLPAEEDVVRNSGGSGGGGNEAHSPPAISGGGDSGHPPPAESCGMSIYSCHLPSDVIWAPTARPPPPY